MRIRLTKVFRPFLRFRAPCPHDGVIRSLFWYMNPFCWKVTVYDDENEIDYTVATAQDAAGLAIKIVCRAIVHANLVEKYCEENGMDGNDSNDSDGPNGSIFEN